VIESTPHGLSIYADDEFHGTATDMGGTWAIYIHAYNLVGLADPDNEWLHAFAPSEAAAVAVIRAFYAYAIGEQ